MCNLQIGQFEKRKDVFWLILHSEREWYGGTYKPTELEESPGLQIYVISNPLTLLFIYVCVLCVFVCCVCCQQMMKSNNKTPLFFHIPDTPIVVLCSDILLNFQHFFVFKGCFREQSYYFILI